MQPETLNCPMCGAPAATDSSKCQHCGARLAMASCPSCFGMMFAGSKFCPRCGSESHRASIDDGEPARSCPRCRSDLASVAIGDTRVKECPKCEGLWVGTAEFEKICARSEEQAAVLGAAKVAPQKRQTGTNEVRYVPCPYCGKLMNRVNFANCSGVIIDVCRSHGVWFDREELTRVVEFIRSGGMALSQEQKRRELAEQERRVRQLQNARAGGRDAEAADIRLAAIGSTRSLLRALSKTSPS